MADDSAYRVNLPAFEGPLDLLLYLVRREELDIWDISIARITERYLQFLELMQELDLDVAGEFLMMAATLTAIKSRMLLPRTGTEEEDELVDPRTTLIERLLEYQRFKEAGESFSKLGVLNRDTFERGQPALQLPEGAEPRMPELSLFDLLSALQTVMGQARARQLAHHVTAERFSVVERIHWLHDRLASQGSTGFRALLGALTSRMDIILTFLALLEMAKAHILDLQVLEWEGEGEQARPVDWYLGLISSSGVEAMDLEGIDD